MKSTPNPTVSSFVVPDKDRVNFVHKLFGHHFPLRLEPAVFSIAGELAADYNGGLWTFVGLSNGGFYMAPESALTFDVSCENGFAGTLSAEALGITVCLYAYSRQSFGGDAFAGVCADHFHLLRGFALDHAEVAVIFAAID